VGCLTALGGIRGEDRAGGTDHGRALRDEPVDAVAEAQFDEALLDALAHPPHEGLEDAGAGAPGDVETRHGVAVPGRRVATAFGPADHGEERDALLAQPGTLLAGREGEVGLGPLARPVVFGAIELGAAHPVLAGELVRVADAHAALLRRVDE